MRFLPLALLIALSGCAGHVADFVGPKADIIAPELPRYGLSEGQTGCIAGRLGDTLTPLQLRLFARAAGSVTAGYFDPERLTMRDLMHVAASVDHPEVGQELVRAAAACGATEEMNTRREESQPPPAEVRAEADAEPEPVWLNLGAAPTGQSIAVNASTIEQNGLSRTAWFRMTDPGEAEPSPDSYLLSVACAAKTINPKARRRSGADGEAAEFREYPDNPLPVEDGTVMEIAWLALCT